MASKNVNSTQTAGHKDSLFARIDPAKDLPPPDINYCLKTITECLHHLVSVMWILIGAD